MAPALTEAGRQTYDKEQPGVSPRTDSAQPDRLIICYRCREPYSLPRKTQDQR
jgi:hypothetical protein